MTALRLHRCTVKDLPALKQISRDTFHAAYEALNDPVQFERYTRRAFSSEQLLKELNTGGCCFYFVLKEGEVVAYFKVNEWLSQSDLQLPNTLELERIYVRDSAKGQGIGKWIIRGVKRMAAAKGLDSVWLGVWEKNPDAIAFYRALGFQKFGEHAFYIGEEKQTDWLMRLETGAS